MRVEWDTRDVTDNVWHRFSMFVFGAVHGDADVLNLGHVFQQAKNVREDLHIYFVPKTEVEEVAP